MGHGYGRPHSDNSDGDDDTYDNPWDVMSDAWSNAMYNVNFGALPKHINMAQRDRLGWVDAERKRVIPAGDLARTTVQLDFAHLAGAANPQRSEEHTSELQSLMRISYDVFCLQKKSKQQ